MRLIVAGSRDFTDYELLKERLDHFLQNYKHPVEIVSGGARGADKLGERYAAEKGYKVIRFPAQWDTHGKKAGYLRNKEMAEYATHCVCFWDQKSPGTESMIELADRLSLNYRIVYTNKKNIP